MPPIGSLDLPTLYHMSKVRVANRLNVIILMECKKKLMS